MYMYIPTPMYSITSTEYCASDVYPMLGIYIYLKSVLVFVEIVTQIAFSQDCKYLYTVSGDSCIFVWRLSREITQVGRRVHCVPKLHEPCMWLVVYLQRLCCKLNQ